LRLNSQLNGKNHQTTFDDFVCDENHLKKDKYQLIAVCEVKLKLFPYICTQSLSKRIINKELHIVLFGRVC
jgi:hypothetical protein